MDDAISGALANIVVMSDPQSSQIGSHATASLARIGIVLGRLRIFVSLNKKEWNRIGRYIGVVQEQN